MRPEQVQLMRENQIGFTIEIKTITEENGPREIDLNFTDFGVLSAAQKRISLFTANMGKDVRTRTRLTGLDN